jgi:hypothetical protein
MNNNNILLFILLFLIVILTSCSQKGVIELNNLKNDTTIRIPIKWITRDPTNIILNINGYAEDTCKINEYIFLPKGVINTTINLDFYDNKYFEFYYHKYKSQKTSLKIDYIIPGYFF